MTSAPLRPQVQYQERRRGVPGGWNAPGHFSACCWAAPSHVLDPRMMLVHWPTHLHLLSHLVSAGTTSTTLSLPYSLLSALPSLFFSTHLCAALRFVRTTRSPQKASCFDRSLHLRRVYSASSEPDNGQLHARFQLSISCYFVDAINRELKAYRASQSFIRPLTDHLRMW